MNNIVTKIKISLERLIKTDVSYLIKGGFWLSMNQFVGILSGFVLSVIFANFLPKEVYGTYKYIITIAAIIGTFSLTGMNTAITRAVARGYEGNVKKSFLYQLKWNTFFITSSSVFVSVYYLFKEQYIFAMSILVIGLLMPIINASNTYSAFLSGKKLFKKIFFYNLGLNLINIIFLTAVILLSDNVFLIILVYYGIQAISYGYSYMKSLRDVRPNEKSDQSVDSYGTHLSFINIMTGIAQNLDKLLAFHLLGPLNLAIYNFATAIPAQIGGLGKILSSVSFPKISERHNEGKKIDYKKKTLQIALVFALLSCVYILFAPFIYQIFFPQYLDSIFYSQLCSLIFITTAPSLFLNGILQSSADKKALTRLSALTSMTQVACIIIGALSYGLIGLVVAHIVSSIVNFIFTYCSVSKQEKISPFAGSSNF